MGLHGKRYNKYNSSAEVQLTEVILWLRQFFSVVWMDETRCDNRGEKPWICLTVCVSVFCTGDRGYLQWQQCVQRELLHYRTTRT